VKIPTLDELRRAGIDAGRVLDAAEAELRIALAKSANTFQSRRFRGLLGNLAKRRKALGRDA
jgi:hypothetical protein